MTSENLAETNEPSLLGRTILTGRALQRLALGVTCDAAEVSTDDVSVSLVDDAGRLKAEVTVPVILGPGQRGSLAERGMVLRQAITHGMKTFADRDVSLIDIRFSGARHTRKTRRVS